MLGKRGLEVNLARVLHNLILRSQARKDQRETWKVNVVAIELQHIHLSFIRKEAMPRERGLEKKV